MFPDRYFPNRFYNNRYWPPGASTEDTTSGSTITTSIIGRDRYPSLFHHGTFKHGGQPPGGVRPKE